MHRSLWLQGVDGDAPTAQPLTGRGRADVAVIGGGYVGLWTATCIKQARPVCDVVVLERDTCGGGASGRMTPLFRDRDDSVRNNVAWTLGEIDVDFIRRFGLPRAPPR